MSWSAGIAPLAIAAAERPNLRAAGLQHGFGVTVLEPVRGDDAIVYRDVLSILRGAKREVLIISPYFIPVDEVQDVFRELRRRGVSVRVLTNSLASTDMPPAFAA